MREIKGLTLTQPWATLVASGAKKIETRSWNTKHRGWLAIHTARLFPRECRELYDDEPVKHRDFAFLWRRPDVQGWHKCGEVRMEISLFCESQSATSFSHNR